ncbi:lactonase family protein [Sphingobium sp. BYY-5]|uniref:lactonase family protein n=1 Tax=Sphingobium sp. BYY-5 TaxID=2926400 RepID=UPI001FA7F8CE|nr:lactonase family protein [Sphingobium sp. BYY-5]MCI4588939.1 lactonase family protein [Sphingobium sp. BYY-5]
MERRHFTIMGLAAALSGSIASARAMAACAGPRCGAPLLYIGTQGSGPGQGIFAARFDPATGALSDLGLAIEAERPTWLVRDPRKPVLYTVSETGDDDRTQGGVLGYAVDRGTGGLKLLGRVDSGGAGPAHLSYDAASRTLFVANYGTGQVGAIAVKADGTPDAMRSVQAPTGSGPHWRQKGPHAHAAVMDPSGRYLLAADLGTDRLFVYRFDPVRQSLEPAATPALALPPGSGPRHLTFSPDGRFAFLDTELLAEVHAYRWDARSGTLTQTARVALDAPDFAGTRSAAEIAVSPDGRFLYVSNRGANLMHVFAIDRKSGGLTEVQRIDCGGRVPWSFGIDLTGRWLIVTNQGSGNLAVFGVDRASGRLRVTGHSLAVDKPVSLAFFP